VWRNGATRELSTKLVEVAPDKTAAAVEPATPSGKLGLTVRPLSSDEQKQLGTSGGVVVQEVAGPAATAGIEPGDVIIAVNNEQVKSVSQLQQLTDKSKGGSIAVLVQRDKQRIYIPVKVG
jgi:serine protease Do